MARTAQGWRLWWSRGVGQVRFIHAGKRHSISTGECDSQRAAARAAEIYADVIAGRHVPARRVAVAQGGPPLAEVVELFLVDFAAGRPRGGASGLYRLHFRKHLAPFFGDIGAISEVRIADYQTKRLGEVTRKTLVKELNTLRTFLKWLKRRGLAESVPAIPELERGKLGTSAQERKTTALSRSHVRAFLDALPESVVSRKEGGGDIWVRPYFELLYETGLRPATVQALEVPEHWAPGRRELVVTDEIDKARFGRTLPLTKRAVAALERAAPEQGVIFGRHDLRVTVERVCRAAGVPRLTPYDLRHARATHLIDRGASLTGVGYLLGHKQVTTTNRYAKPNERAARDALRSGSKRGGKPGGRKK